MGKHKILTKIMVAALAVMCVMGGLGQEVFADSGSAGFLMTPMTQRIVLSPGETYKSAFKIVYKGIEDGQFNYKINVTPYFVSDEYESIYTEQGDYSQIVNWITIDASKTGTLSYSEEKTIPFTIKVPLDAPAGGQYAAIMVGTNNDLKDVSDSGSAVMLNEQIAIAHTIFAEIAGDTVKQGEIFNLSVPSFLLDGNIEASSSVRNTGNVHGTAKYTLQIWPLFSNEEVYTNEETPEYRNIMPGRTYLNTTVWENTPIAGIFNVVYTVEFEGVTQQVSKMVIKCPIWLLFIIIFAIAAIIIYFVARAKARKSPRKAETE